MTTKNNWFTTNLNERNKNKYSRFEITINPYKFTPTEFNIERKRVAHELVEKFDKLYLCYSGGLDSELVLKTFIEEKLPITPVITDTPYNKIEVQFAYDFCRKNNIVPEVLQYNKNDFIERLKEKTIDRNLFSLLGGIPLIICDEVNKVSGKVITGYGDPFEMHSGIQPTTPISTTLCFSEWDYYLDSYDVSHPSGFFTYDIGLFHSLIQEIDYSQIIQHAKSKLYGLEYRPKMFWADEFYALFREIMLDIHQFDISMSREQVLNKL